MAEPSVEESPPSGRALPIERALAGAALLLLAIGTYIVLRPFISALLWATIITFSTAAPRARLERWLGGRRSLAAILMTLLVGLVIVLPLVLVSATLTDSVGSLIGMAREALDKGIGPPPYWLGELPLVGNKLHDYWVSVAAGEPGLADAARPYLSVAGGWLLSVLAGIGGGILELVLSLVLAFFLFRDGGTAASRLYLLASRVAGARGTRALDIAGGTIKGVVYGVIGANLVQGVLSAAGFWAAGVPGAFLLGFLCFFFTLIPTAPTLVWVPASLWVFYEGSTGTAIALAVWSFVIFNPLENLLRPYLISRGSSLPIILILLGMLGGLAAFGLLGIVVGPTILAIVYVLASEWAEGTQPAADGAGR